MAKNLKNLIIVIIVIFGISIGGYFLYKNNKEVAQENLLTPQQAAEKAINYINQYLLEEGITASLIEVVEDNGLYEFKLKVQDEEHSSYVTKDGKLLFLGGFDMDQTSAEFENSESEAQEIPKEDKPDVKLFVMAYCPFGLEAQKMFLPVYELLGDKTEMGIYFVNYIMHEKKEIDENIRQYCIQKEQREKYHDYLTCFVKNGSYEDENAFENCLTETKIDKGRLASCVSATDKEYKIIEQYDDKSTWLSGSYPKFDIHDSLNQKYEIGGSPTVVINDKVVSINPRSPEKFKEVLCQSFNSPPEECSQTLSENAFSSGFGLEEGASSGGECK